MKKLFLIPHQTIFYFGLITLVISLPFSPLLISLSQFILAGNLILEGNFSEKLKLFKERKSIQFILVIFFLHLAGLFYTSDFEYALKDIKIKLPILVFPLVLGLSKPIPIKMLKILLNVFVGVVVLKSLISSAILVHVIDNQLIDIRTIAGRITHIPLSLMIDLCISILVYFLFFDKEKYSIAFKIIYILVLIWLIIFLFLLQAFTGLVILFCLLIFIPLFISSFKISSTQKYISRIFSISVIILISTILLFSILQFYNIEKVDKSRLDKYTSSGNLYYHIIENNEIENGHYVYLYICEKELIEEWNKISTIPYEGSDKKGQTLKFTLIRYLSSRGYRKDAVGIRKLTKKDIANIENGIANYIYEKKLNPYAKLYGLIWEIDGYLKGVNSSNHSVAQRLEFFKTGLNIIKSDFWIGVGTGDVKIAYDNQYIRDKSNLPVVNRLRAHNQFLTFFISFGFVGFIIIIASTCFSVHYEKKWASYFFINILLITILSMFSDDMLETQAGATFLGFFFSLFLFSKNIEGKNMEEETQYTGANIN